MADHTPSGHQADRLSAFLDEQLDDDQALAVARHLDGCERCLAELDDIRAARTALRGLPRVVPPAGTFAGVTAAAARARSTRIRHARLVVAGAIVLVGMVVGGFAAGGERGSVVPPVELYVVDHVTRTGGGPMITPVDLRDGG